jgi:hypothetical protein
VGLLVLALFWLSASLLHAANLITNQSPATQIIGTGSDATFFVQADSQFSPLTYQWQFKGSAIPSATNSNLTVSGITYANDGCYTALVSGNAGSQTSSCMELVSMDLAKALNATNMTWTPGGTPLWTWETDTTLDTAAVVSGPRDVVFGHTSYIEATVLGPGTLDFWWRMNVAVPNLDDMQFAINGTTLSTFSGVTFWTHSSQYYLGSGTNTLRWTYNGSYYAFLDQVSFAAGGTSARITTAPGDQTVSAGANVTLTVSATGTPPLQYQWQFSGTNISGATKSSLTVSNAQSSSAGSYTVTVTNNFGGEAASANVTVTPAAPRFTHQPISANSLLGAPATLVATVQGSEPFICQWLFNGTPLTGATNLALLITNVTMSSAGSYQITVTNTQGGIVSSNAVLCAGHTIVVGWGNGQYAGTNAPVGLTNAVYITTTAYTGTALRSDGTVTAWGLNQYNLVSYCTNLSNVVTLAGGAAHELALRSDGTVVAWGNNSFNQTNVPAGLSNVVAIAAGSFFSVALKEDGRVVCWGQTANGQTNVPPTATNLVAIAAANEAALALRRDGTVVAWAANNFGRTNVPPSITNVIAIATGDNTSFAVRSDGTVVAWGNPMETNVPPGTANVSKLAEGSHHNLALKSDGTVAAWLYTDGSGSNAGQTNVPSGLSNVIAIAANGLLNYAIMSDAAPQMQAAISNPFKPDASSFQCQIPTQPGRVYGLEYNTSNSPATWLPLPLRAGVIGRQLFTDPAATNATRYYRLRRW